MPRHSAAPQPRHIPRCPAPRAWLLVAIIFLIGITPAFSHEPTELPKLLQLGHPLRDLAGNAGDAEVFRFVVPKGATNLTLKSSGSRGDVDLYVRKGAHPTASSHDFASTGSTTQESITIDSPEEGVWYVLVEGITAFRGVRLQLKYRESREQPRVPRIVPGQGNYAGSARVRIQKTSIGGTVHYTTDGSDPTTASPRYRRSLILTETCTLKARTFLRSGAASPVVEARIEVKSNTEPETLTAGDPVHHLAGNHGTMRYFKVSVPPGQNRLRIVTSGGTGNTSLFVRHGAIPTVGNRDYKANRPRNTAQLDIPNPAPGEWFIGLRGLSNYSGVSLLAILSLDQPDLIVWPELLEPYIVTERFFPGDCEVQEGLVVAGVRKLLRFTTETRNIGGADIVMGSPIFNPLFVYHSCHGHYHFNGFASYRLLDTEGQVAATGIKVSFCLEDIRPWAIDAPIGAVYDCLRQGIQAGWADIYDSGLPGQWIDITGVPPGDYFIEIHVNPDQILLESDYTNNKVTVPFTIPGEVED